MRKEGVFLPRLLAPVVFGLFEMLLRPSRQQLLSFQQTVQIRAAYLHVSCILERDLLHHLAYYMLLSSRHFENSSHQGQHV